MYIFEYEQQQFISLKDIVERIGLRLDQLITLDNTFTKYLCFFYCGIIYDNEGKPSRYKGIVYPDSNLICTHHLKAALKHSSLYYTPTEDEYGQKQKEEEDKLFLKSDHKDYQDAFLDAGKASKRNIYNYTGRYTIPTFYLQDYILPYYVLPIDYMTSFFKNHNMEDATSNSKVELKKLNELKTIQKLKPQHYPILDGDILKALLESLQSQLVQAQEEINTLKSNSWGENLARELQKNELAKVQQKIAELEAKNNNKSPRLFCDTGHPDYAPELHQAVLLWEHLYLDDGIDKHSHERAVELWFKQHYPSVQSKSRFYERVKSVTCPATKKPANTPNGST